MSDTTQDRLEQIAQRAEAATEGPWGTEECTAEFADVRSMDPGSLVCVTVVNEAGDNIGDITDYLDPADAEFIAHARTDIPAMHAALMEVLELCDEWDFADRYAYALGYRPQAEQGAERARRVRAAINDALGGE